MLESSEALRGVKCPGCHFECALEKYQCGRGLEFLEFALAGGEVPKRDSPIIMTPSAMPSMPSSSASSQRKRRKRFTHFCASSWDVASEGDGSASALRIEKRL